MDKEKLGIALVVNGRRYIWKLSSDELAKVRTGIFLNTDVLGILILMLDLVLKKKIGQTINYHVFLSPCVTIVIVDKIYGKMVYEKAVAYITNNIRVEPFASQGNNFTDSLFFA